jgi:hypothetical protein
MVTPEPLALPFMLRTRLPVAETAFKEDMPSIA